MKDCNYSIYLAGQSIDKIDAVNKGYQKAIEEMSKIIHSKDNLDFLDEDDLGNIIFQLCEYFEIKNIDSKFKINQLGVSKIGRTGWINFELSKNLGKENHYARKK